MDSDDILKVVLGVLAAIILFPLVLMALFMPFAAVAGPMGYRTGGLAWLVGLLPLVVLVLLAWLVYRLLSGRRAAERDPAIRELRASYARGEITTEEFDERMERLESTPPEE